METIKRKWIKTSDRLPTSEEAEKGTDHADCFIFRKSGYIEMRPFNIKHHCWDDQEYDDHYCDALEPTHWMLNKWPEKPELSK